MINKDLIDKYDGFEIAIIGMAGKFPGADNVAEFWNNLVKGKETVSFFDEEELRENGVDEELLKNPNYVKAKGYVKDADKFDASFFGFYPREAEILDPQHRLFLETSWNALEDAGYVPDRYEGLIGVFGGVGMNTYLLSFIQANEGFISSSEGYQLSIANDKDFLTTRISYKLNLRGPSLDIQTACSTSLVATHIACMNLLNYQCDMALAGGVTISFPEKSGYLYQEGMILSPDGHCKPFDEKANGTVVGNGAGVVVLKRLSDAIEDGDHIYAIIKGSAYNNDGGLRVGYTAPGVNGQIEVINSALAVANVNPESISYIETHGTGTELGDPIEIEALTQAFKSYTDKKRFCAIGSVKSNVGHLDTAAGVTGLMKAALCLHNKTLVPSINFEKPNPKIDFENSPFFVNTELKEWKRDNEVLRAGVSSFGIGGTNAHVILEEAPKLSSSLHSRPFKLLTVSAKSTGALERNTVNLGNYLKNNINSELTDVAYTLQIGRKHFEYRNILVAENIQEAAEILGSLNYKKILSGKIIDNDTKPEYVFMFSGQGSQYINMGKDLYKYEKTFKKYVDECSEILKPVINIDLRDILFPNTESEQAAKNQINQTEITQVALFTIEYALAQLYISLGIVPSLMIGHSIGEYVAATLSGVFALEDALRIVALRGKLMQSLPTGAMLSVKADENTLKRFVGESISIAAINGNNLTAVSGTFDDIENLEKLLKAENIGFTRLKTSHAFHSVMMEPILNEFTEAVEKTELHAPQIPYYSNVSGRLIQEHEAIDPAYYSRHLRYTVRFADSINEIVKSKNRILIEIGPGNVLTTLTKSNPAAKDVTVISSMRHPKEKINDEYVFLSALGQLWINGAEINWSEYYKGETRLRVSLPTYSYDKKRYWLNIKESGSKRKKRKFNNEYDWIYFPIWKQAPYFPERKSEKKYLVVVDSTDTLKSKIESILKSQEINYQIFDNNNSNLKDKFDEIIYFVDNEINIDQPKDFILYEELNRFTDFIKLLNKVDTSRKINLLLITNELLDVNGYEKKNLSGSLLTGVLKVLSQERPNTKCIHFDIDNNDESFIKLLEKEFETDKYDKLALRKGKVWVSDFVSMEDFGITEKSLLKENGNYIVIGGLGNIGLAIAEHLAKKYKANIALLSRSNFPEEDNWNDILNSPDSDMITKINILKNVKNFGAKILIQKCDIVDANELNKTLTFVENEFGRIDGIFHTAGITGKDAFVMINEINENDIHKQLSAKVGGLINLNNEIKNRSIDFVALQSSISVELGGLGLSLYASANGFMNYFVNKTNGNTKWLSIDWDTWQFENDGLADKTGLAKYSLKPEQGIKMLDSLINSAVNGNVIISTGDLNERIEEISKGKESSEEENTGSLHERPNIPTPYKEPKTELEKEILTVWQKLLGIEKIGIYDNFFDLGGNSLSGTQLVSELREKFQVELPLQSLFDDPTISGVAEIIEKEKGKAEETLDVLDDVISQVENLSEEEINKILNNKNSNELEGK